MIVGALVTGALALGAGTASAAPETCTAGDTQFVLSGTLQSVGGICFLGDVVAALEDLKTADFQTLAEYEAAEQQRLEQERLEQERLEQERLEQERLEQERLEQEQREQQQEQVRLEEEQRVAQQRAAEQQAQRDAAAREAAAAAQRAAQAQAAAPANLLAPGAGGGAGLLAGVPTLNFGAPNVGLLSPVGSPLRPLTGLTPASPVTTTSDVQAMALDSVPAGLGTPAVVGTLILSALAAFALRHRVLHRARRAAEADTVETPVRASVS
ncbi:hypothetical protein [Actinomycetospora lemnae]|uniref:Uncharacterized protein n=1 Tax=Actinomycetospora lemnae TaxID=3019891 RepID=A0ABT5SWJ2_9PSEU|nr:hypothetical protein [Actinomycetospora sp. DW7H6]MDD7967227.1 hypothetical protein [Actinomycetospora sp. DW7H6]